MATRSPRSPTRRIVETESLLMEDMDKEFDFWKFLMREFGIYDRVYRISDNTFYKKKSDIEKIIATYFFTWIELEKFLFFGIMICLDLFLSIAIFLPFRVFFGFFVTLYRRTIHPYHMFDFLRLVTIVVSTYCLFYMDYSLIYHYVREQSTLKLYVMYNMLGVFDKLSTSFGEDYEDYLFYMFSCSPKSSKNIYRILLTPLSLVGYIVFVFLHSSSHLFKLTILNVSVNSTTSTLIQLLISINFVELKKSVFKRFSNRLLFQTSCLDVVERFELIIFSVLIMFKNIQAGATLLPILYLIIAEVAVDVVKHTFILKFNSHTRHAYKRFKVQFYRDILSVNKKVKREIRIPLRNKILDHHNLLCRRFGFLSLPIVSVFLKGLYYAYGWTAIGFFAASFFLVKITVSWSLVHLAYNRIKSAEKSDKEYQGDVKLFKNVFRYKMVDKRIIV